MEAVVLLVTAPDMEMAETIVTTLLERRLIACANIVPGAISHYRWKGKLYRDEEVILILKSLRSRLEAVEKTVKECHSYETPEILALDVAGGSREYLNWLRESI